MPQKGEHGKKAYIIYKGSVEKDILKEVDEKANELIAKNIPISWKFVSLEVLEEEAIYLQPGLPINKPLRMVTFEGIGSVADGGTLLKNTSEVGKIVIKDIQTSGEETKVSYRVE
jgi:Ser-tRNA(Ala) deacylase AlaX